MSFKNSKCNLYSKSSVDEINKQILARNIATGNIEVLISDRPLSTLYTYPYDNLIPPKKCNSIILKYATDDNKQFLPSTSKGQWHNFSNNINTESVLRNQIYPLEKGPHNQYIPNSNSDLYNSTISNSLESTAQGLYPNLPNINSYKGSENDIWGLQPNSHYNYPFLSPPVNLGNKLFDNSTRQFLKDN